MTARVEPFDPLHATAEQARVYADFVADRRGEVGLPGGVYDLLLRNPEAARRLAAVGAYARSGTGLDVLVVEAAILATSHALGFSYGIRSHEAIAGRMGLTGQQLEDLRTGAHDRLPGPMGAAADLCRAAALGAVPAALFEAAVAAHGETGAIDLAVVAGYYAALFVAARVLDPGLAGGGGPAEGHL